MQNRKECVHFNTKILTITRELIDPKGTKEGSIAVKNFKCFSIV